MGIDLEVSSSQYVDLGDDLAASNGAAAVAVACWVKIESAVTTMGLIAIGVAPPEPVRRARLALEIRSSRLIQIVTRIDDVNSVNSLSLGTPLTIGQWAHVVAIVDIANDISEIYIDGVLDTAFTPSYGPSAFNATDSTRNALGSRSDGSDEWLDGVMADARIYMGTPRMTAVEVGQIFHGRGKLRVLRNLQHRWLLGDRAAGTTATGAGTLKDEGFRQRNATPVASPIYAETELSPRRRVG